MTDSGTLESEQPIQRVYYNRQYKRQKKYGESSTAYMWFLGIFGSVYEEIGVTACRKRRSPCEVLRDQVVLHDGSILMFPIWVIMASAIIDSPFRYDVSHDSRLF
jgi:hypothetical protein